MRRTKVLKPERLAWPKTESSSRPWRGGLEVETSPPHRVAGSFEREIVTCLANSLKVDATFVSIYDEGRGQVQTLAIWKDGQIVKNRTYLVAGTPCQSVLNGFICHYADRVAELFPDDQNLAQMKARSYVAVPLIDVRNRIFGHMAAIDRKPMPELRIPFQALYTFGSRTTEQLRENQERNLEPQRVTIIANRNGRSLARPGLNRNGEQDKPLEIVGTSQAILKVLREIERIAPTECTVLIRGETGTGKELIAQNIHHYSDRADKPLVRVNCAALPETLIESELFGHEKGAFTGALTQRPGRFELAHGGTLFLDEIGDLSLHAQARLLRVLQEQEFERVGGTQTLRVDVRILAATHQDLERKVRDGQFRADLYYRIHIHPLVIPPLRERGEDIAQLAQTFMENLAPRVRQGPLELRRSLIEELEAYDWPGNVRELQNVIERALIHSTGEVLSLPSGLLNHPFSPPDSVSGRRIASLEEVERQHILRALDLTGGKVAGQAGAASLLHVNPSTLRSRIAKLGITETEWKDLSTSSMPR